MEDFLTDSILILSIFSGAYFVPMPALPAPQPVVSTSPRSSGCDDGCTGDCWLNFCFKCDNDEDWYSLNGKGKNLREATA